MAKLADARDLKSRAPKGAWRFDSAPGHHFTYVAGFKDERRLITTYTVRADPLTPESGDRSFFADETGVIRFEKGKPAGPTSPPLQ